MQPLPDHRLRRPRTRSGPAGSFSTGAAGRSLVLVLATLLWAAVGAARADIIPPGCSGNGYGISLFVDKPLARVGDTLNYTLLLSNQEFPACQAEQIEAAIVTPDGVTRAVTLRRTVLDPGQSDLYRDVVAYVVRQQDITNAVVQAAGISRAQINQSTTGIRSDNYRDVSTPIVNSCLDIAATCNGGVGETGVITFAGTVRNCGTTTLNNVTVNNSLTGATVLGPISLAPGEEQTFSGSFVPPEPCAPTTVTLTAQGVDNIEPLQTVTDSAQVTCQNTLNPAVAISADCGAQSGAPGQPLAYGGIVRNTGNITLTDLVIVANQPAANTTVQTIARLAPGEAANFTGSYPAPDACSSTVSLAVNGRSLCNVAVNASAAITCPIQSNPAISISSGCPATPPAPGGRLDYSGTVRNTGNVALRNVRVVDSQTGDQVVFSTDSLAAGASQTFTGSFTVPGDCCAVTHTLMVTAEDVCAATPVADTSTSTCPILYNPALAVTKECSTNPLEPGDTLNFTGTVSNPGNITLVDVMVRAQVQGQSRPVIGPIALAPGQTVHFKSSYIVTADSCGQDELIATGTDLCAGQETTARVVSVCPVMTMPMIAVVKHCPTTPVPRNGTFEYSGTVSNVGNVTLTNVMVFNDMPADGTVVFGPVTLAPGASRDFTGSYPIDAKCCWVVDTLTARGQDLCSGEAVVYTATAVCDVLYAPALELTKACQENNRFTGIVKNSGNIVLTNVYVAIQLPAGNLPILGPIELAVGETATFEGDSIAGADVVVAASGEPVCGDALATARTTCAGPVSSAPEFTDILVSDGNVVLRWTAIPGSTYRVQYTTSLAPADWQDLPGDVTATTTIASKSDTVGSQARRFYRILALP